MSLTSYQQAVLQEMGIPVWITKDAYTELKQEDQAKQNNTNAVQRMGGTANSSLTQIHHSQSAQANKPPSTPISQEEKQSRLAQLRASVGGGAKDKAKPKDGGAAKLSTPGASRNDGKVGQSETDASQSRSTSPSYGNVVKSQTSVTKYPDAKGPVSPEGIPLSAEQKAKSQPWLKDLQLACIQLGIPSQWAGTIMIGRTLSVTETAIILPATPLKLTTVQKRELWTQLINAARELNHSANGQ